MKQKRWRSWVVWTTISTLVLFILKNYGLLTVIGLTPESYKELTDLIFAVAMALGIINNPTRKDVI